MPSLVVSMASQFASLLLLGLITSQASLGSYNNLSLLLFQWGTSNMQIWKVQIQTYFRDPPWTSLFYSVWLSVSVQQQCSLFNPAGWRLQPTRDSCALVSPPPMSSRHRILERYGRWHATLFFTQYESGFSMFRFRFQHHWQGPIGIAYQKIFSGPWRECANFI